MPVISAGQWGGQAATALNALGSDDALYLAGSGIQSYPMGIAAGVEAIRAAWSAALVNVPLEIAERESPALTRSIEYFGYKSLWLAPRLSLHLMALTSLGLRTRWMPLSEAVHVACS